MLSFYTRKTMMKRMGTRTGTAGIFGSGIGGGELKYYFMGCGIQRSQAARLKCGSKMKRGGS
jgi:hypothetical protein